MIGRWSKRFLSLGLVAAFVGGPPVATAHHKSVAEALTVLNGEEVKAKTGIREARVDRKLDRHLIIYVSPEWYALSDPYRRKLAISWLRLWRDAVPRGIVSVVDAKSHQPVVNYGPGGSVSLAARANPG